MLKDKGLKRSIVLRSGQLSTLKERVMKSDLLLAGPNILIENEDWTENFAPVYTFNQQQDHVTDVYLISHQRIALSEAHQWFQKEFLTYNKLG